VYVRSVNHHRPWSVKPGHCVAAICLREADMARNTFSCTGKKRKSNVDAGARARDSKMKGYG
jgi:hypothetical protein